MFASMRSKSKKAVHGAAGTKTDQQPQPTQRRDAMPAPLQLAEKPLYYPGTSMPMEGWFHACRLCRCWTAFSATAATGELVPLCRRCLPVAARKGLSTSRGGARSSPQQQPQQQQQHSGSTAATAADVRSRLPATYPAAAAATAAPKASPLAGAQAAADMQPATKTGSDPARVVTSACVPASTVKQQQHHDVAPPLRAQQQDAHSSSAPSAPPASAALGSGSMHASRGAVVHSRPVAYDQQQQHQPYAQQARGAAAAVPMPAGAGAAYASYHKHLGPCPSNMQQSAPADHFIACIDDGGNDVAAAGGGGGSQQSGGSDVLGAITALLADLYRLSFSSSSSALGGCGSSAGAAAAQQPQAGAQDTARQPPV